MGFVLEIQLESF